MKSEHRHELEANSLAGFMNNLPENLRKHSNKIFLVIAGALLVFAGLRYRENQRLVREQETTSALGVAWNVVTELRNRQPLMIRGQAEEVAKLRDEMVETGNRSVDQVLKDSSAPRDAARMASAWLARAELFWTLAGLPPRPEAATRPTLAPKQSASEALDLAAESYRKVLSDFPDQVQPVITARFGLAAIAENKGDFAAAQEQYKALLESDKSAPTDKSLAQERITKLDDLKKPLLLLPATQPMPEPASLSETPSLLPNLPGLKLGTGAFDPVAAPATAPAAAPATAPTTQP